MESEELARFLAKCLEDKKARDVVIIDVREQTSMTDFLVVCEGDTDRQVRSMVENLQEACKAQEIDVYHVDGMKDGTWICLDCGEVIVHVLLPGERSYYRIEDLWGMTEPRLNAIRS